MKDESTFERSFVTLFREQTPKLFRYLARLTGDSDVAADFTQETFVRLYERGSLPDDVRAWLVTVATNLLRDQGRTDARRSQLLTRFDTDVTPASQAPADVVLEVAERESAVRAALSSLPERDRQLLLLRHEGYSYQEIAKVVGVSSTSVGTLLIRATSAFHAAYTRSDARAS